MNKFKTFFDSGEMCELETVRRLAKAVVPNVLVFAVLFKQKFYFLFSPL